MYKTPADQELQGDVSMTGTTLTAGTAQVDLASYGTGNPFYVDAGVTIQQRWRRGRDLRRHGCRGLDAHQFGGGFQR